MYTIELNDPLFLPHFGCDLSITLSELQPLVLVGENGIGKTTLLNSLSRKNDLIHASKVEQKALEIFYDRTLSRLKDIFLNSKLARLDHVEFEILWKGFKLNEKEERNLSHLSGGESQALKLCLALCKDTKFYLLDEPSQFLDQTRKEFLASYLNSLKLKHKYILIVEHDQKWLPRECVVQELIIQENKLQKGRTWTT